MDGAEITNECCKVSAPTQDGIRVPGKAAIQQTPAGHSPLEPPRVASPHPCSPGIASREPLLHPPGRLNPITADTHLLLGSKTRSSRLKDSHGHGKLVLIAALMVVWPVSSPKWP